MLWAKATSLRLRGFLCHISLFHVITLLQCVLAHDNDMKLPYCLLTPIFGLPQCSCMEDSTDVISLEGVVIAADIIECAAQDFRVTDMHHWIGNDMDWLHRTIKNRKWCILQRSFFLGQPIPLSPCRCLPSSRFIGDSATCCSKKTNSCQGAAHKLRYIP